MRTIIATLLIAFFAPTLVACQTGRVVVTVRDRDNLRVVVSPESYTGEVGDTITFQAVAIDTISGDTVPSIFLWSSQDSTGVAVEPTTGRATLLRGGTYTLEAFVQTIVGMIITRQQDDGSFREVFTNGRREHYAATGVVPDSLKMVVGETALLCAYLESSDGLNFMCDDCVWSSSNPSVATIDSGGVNICPTWAPGMPFPSAALRVPSRIFQYALAQAQ